MFLFLKISQFYARLCWNDPLKPEWNRQLVKKYHTHSLHRKGFLSKLVMLIICGVNGSYFSKCISSSFSCPQSMGAYQRQISGPHRSARLNRNNNSSSKKHGAQTMPSVHLPSLLICQMCFYGLQISCDLMKLKGWISTRGCWEFKIFTAHFS